MAILVVDLRDGISAFDKIINLPSNATPIQLLKPNLRLQDLGDFPDLPAHQAEAQRRKRVNALLGPSDNRWCDAIFLLAFDVPI